MVLRQYASTALKLPSLLVQFGGSVTVTRSPGIKEGRCSKRSATFKTRNSPACLKAILS